MKAILLCCATIIVGISLTEAQTITCLPMGQSTVCYNGQGGSTTITPMGSGFYSYGNSTWQMGTVYTPPTPQVQPTPVMPGLSRPFPPVRR